MEQDEHQQEVNAPLQLDPISDPQSDSQPDCSQNEMSSTRRKITAIPISRVNAIMRSCPNLTTVKNDAIALTAKAAVRISKLNQFITNYISPGIVYSGSRHQSNGI